MVVCALDDARGIRIAVRPHQAVAAGGVVEGDVAPGAGAGNRIAVDITRQPPGSGADGGYRGHQPGDQQATEGGEQQRAPGCRRLQRTWPVKAGRQVRQFLGGLSWLGGQLGGGLVGGLGRRVVGRRAGKVGGGIGDWLADGLALTGGHSFFGRVGHRLHSDRTAPAA